MYGPLNYSNACTFLAAQQSRCSDDYNEHCFLSGVAYQSAFTPKNILARFKYSGIWPFNRDVFTNGDFEGYVISLLFEY